MKASLQTLQTKKENSFSSYWVNANSFGFHWHYHPEIEICYVHKGVGTRMVGDSVTEFSDGDLVLVGSNLPHTWISKNFNNNLDNNMQVMVVQFMPEILEQNLLQLPEFQRLAILLQNSKHGIFFQDKEKNLSHKLLQLTNLEGFEKLILLFSLLNVFANDKDSTLLASKNYTPFLSKENEKRMQNIFQYIHQNFYENITLNKIADIACMNQASFCRYFQKNIGQTFTEYLNDLRINKACQLLIETDESVLNISNIVGYGSFSNFNKNFLFRKKIGPREFRKAFLGK